MKRLVLSFATLLLVVSNLFSQNKFSVSAAFGVMNAFGAAEGIEIGCKQPVSDHLSFQLVGAYYSWSSKGDVNAYRLNSGQYFNSLDYYLHHVRKEVNTLVPIRLGFNYSIGNTASHPFFGLEWTINIINYNSFLPDPVIDTSVPFVVTYSKMTTREMFVSLGFDLGYSFYLSKEMNVVAQVKYQMGKTMDYVAFVSGIEYLF
ncbi:MAG: hypothetical protein M1495_10545 [Bacteroidetes bacterium]|nr:hypothetical protein [Bacteroidota bacterium]